ncbi:MAG TPA: M48 family metalloprotease, partial [Ktedonobacterales bacterium]
ARVKAPAPHRVILVPGSAAYVYQHRPLHRFFRRELVMGLGVGMLAPLTIQDAKALMAHELAHYRRGDTFLHRHFWRAETALHRIIESLVEGTASTDAGRPWWGNSSTIVYAKILVLVATLPISVLWWLVHLLRLAESRHAEFAADHLSARTYGAQAFINGLTGLAMASNTLRGAGASLRDEMLRRGERNIYGVLRDHYAALPANVLRDLRAQTVTGFRSLELTHPIRPDRLRAVSLVSHTDTPSDEMARPAMELLVPAGASDAEEIERALTELWLNQGKRKRR